MSKKVELKDVETKFLENRIIKIKETNRDISQLQIIINEKKQLVLESEKIVSEYISLFKLDPQKCTIDFKNNLLSEKSEEETHGTAKSTS